MRNPTKSFILTASVVLSLLSTMPLWQACQHEPMRTPDTSYTVCFEEDVLPILISSCAYTGCHDAVTKAEGVILTSYDNTLSTGGVKPGDPDNSELYTVLYAKGDERMPPDGELSNADIQTIYDWIAQGAENTVCEDPCDTNIFTFSDGVKPIIDGYCVSCHNATLANGNVMLTTHAEIAAQADSGAIPGVLHAANGYPLMPPGNALNECNIRIIEKWIESGSPDN